MPSRPAKQARAPRSALVDDLPVLLRCMHVDVARPGSDQIATRQQKSQPLSVGFLFCRSATHMNSMWSGRWESNPTHSLPEICVKQPLSSLTSSVRFGTDNPPVTSRVNGCPTMAVSRAPSPQFFNHIRRLCGCAVCDGYQCLHWFRYITSRFISASPRLGHAKS